MTVPKRFTAPQLTALHEAGRITPEVIFLSPASLRPTEQLVPGRLNEVTQQILQEARWHEPILVHRASLVIMDGHHRREFALRHGLRRVPCLVVSYADVVLESRCEGLQFDAAEVVARGLSGRLFPPKSTRHTLLVGLHEIPTFALSELL